MKIATRITVISLLICGALAAQEIVGRWAGVADTTDEAGTKRQERQTFEFKREAGKLTGVRLNRSGNGSIPIDVQQDGARINLYSFLPSTVVNISAGNLSSRRAAWSARIRPNITIPKNGFMTELVP